MEMPVQPLTIALATQLRVLSKSSSCDALPKAVSVVLKCNAALLTAASIDELHHVCCHFARTWEAPGQRLRVSCRLKLALTAAP